MSRRKKEWLVVALMAGVCLLAVGSAIAFAESQVIDFDRATAT
ncbi:hypothetical protein [Burkholderia stabilis]|nr:hypothetical protein [Burkholderia stabilis]